VHPGAAAYVDGRNKPSSTVTAITFWFSLMGLSVLGSVGAWFASYLKKDERNTNSSLRERLLDMLANVKAQRFPPMNWTRCRPRPTTSCARRWAVFEHGAIDEGALTAFNIALEQFHNAVADRKALLASMPQNLPTGGRTASRHRRLK